MIENRSQDPLWRNDGGQYLLAECKNWSSHCDAAEFRNFHGKLTGKHKRVRTGIFIAPGGFTSGFLQEKARRTENEVLVIPIDAKALERWIAADDKLAVLRELHRQATFDTPR